MLSNQNKMESLSHFMPVKQNRVRRGWFNGVGSLFKNIFGVLDENDAINYNNAINNIQNEENRLTTLMKDNIHIVSSTINTFNSSMRKLNENEEILNANLRHVNDILANLSNLTDKLELRSRLSMLCNSLESTLLTLSFKIDDTVNAILFSKQNILHPAVISPIRIFNEININHKFVSRTREFPLSITKDNIHILIDISDIITYYYDEKIMFVLQIPLVYPLEYNLYHTIPLPTPLDITHPSLFALITPTQRYMAITNDKLLYVLMDDLYSCKTISKNYLVCKGPNTYSTSTNSCCETRLLTEAVKVLPSECSFKTLYGVIDMWQIISNNRWIYVQSEPSKVSIECNNKDYKDLIISGTGILSLPNYCTAYFKLLRFIPNGSNISISIEPPNIHFNLVEDDCCIRNKYNKSLPFLTPIKLSNIDLDSLKYASHKLDNLNNELNDLENQPSFLQTQHFSILISVTSSLIILYIFYRIIRYFCKKTECCHGIQIFNQCYGQKQVSPKLKTSIELSSYQMSDEDRSDNVSVKSLPVNHSRRIIL